MARILVKQFENYSTSTTLEKKGINIFKLCNKNEDTKDSKTRYHKNMVQNIVLILQENDAEL